MSKKINLIKKNTISLASAKDLVDRAIRKAIELHVGAAVAVVDDGGHLLCFERIDGTMVGACDITIGKAKTALTFKRPGIVLEKTVTEERKAMMAVIGITEMVPLMGSYPIIFNNEVIGAIGVGGAGTPHNDEIIIKYALEALLKW